MLAPTLMRGGRSKSHREFGIESPAGLKVSRMSPAEPLAGPTRKPTEISPPDPTSRRTYIKFRGMQYHGAWLTFFSVYFGAVE